MENIRLLSMRPNLPVADVDRAIASYRDVLGFDVRARFDDGSFALMAAGEAEVALVRDAVPASHGAYLYVTAVEQLRERCLAAGVAATELVREPWGLLDFVVTDPDGNQIAIGEWVSRPG